MSQLDAYRPICTALSHLLPRVMEVVLHDLDSGKIAFIENAFSPRKAGDSSLLETADYAGELRVDETIGPYRKSNSDGSKVKSVSALIRNPQGQAIGLLCINLRTDGFELAGQILQDLAAITGDADQVKLLKNDWRELTNSIISSILNERKINLLAAKRADRLAIVAKLFEGGVFEARGSADYVAEALGISRANLYELLKQKRSSPTELH